MMEKMDYIDSPAFTIIFIRTTCARIRSLFFLVIFRKAFFFLKQPVDKKL